jgi:hypothetical protein
MAKPPEEDLKSCALCGATVYPEHLTKGAADYWCGRLLCPHCLHEKKQIAAVNPAAAYADLDPSQAAAPIALVPESSDDSGGHAASGGPVRTAGGRPAAPAGMGSSASGGSRLGMVVEKRFRRPMLHGSANATRCRTFHCKLTDAAMAYLGDTINEWIDSNEGIEIKFATSSIGTFELKSSSEPHLFLTLFY